jgi:VanZ family protein
MKRHLAVFSAIACIVFFITIVIIANRGEGDQWWGFVGRIPYGDKLGHLGLTGTLSFLCNLALPSRELKIRRLRYITWPTLVLGFLISVEEFSQAFIPTRTCDAVDWLADLTGLAVGQMVARLVHQIRR